MVRLNDERCSPTQHPDFLRSRHILQQNPHRHGERTVCETPDSALTGREIEIDFFRTGDAPGIARLFRQVYGEGYPIRTYYIPDRLIEENDAGHIISCVARTAAGEVVGHDALVLIDRASHLYENAAGAVLPTFRGQSIFPRLFRHTIVTAAERFGVEGIIGEAVCSHVHLQKMCLQLGFKESGLEIDLMPATACTVMKADGFHRVSVLLGFFMNKSEARTVRIPAIYRDQLEYLYADLDVKRTFILSNSENGFPAQDKSTGSMKLFELAQVARIEINSIGADFETFITEMENKALEKDITIFQMWLPLASPSISAATNMLRQHGYFLGGVLPCHPEGDTLLMQKIGLKPHWGGIELYSERARRIGDMIRRDWASI